MDTLFHCFEACGVAEHYDREHVLEQSSLPDGSQEAIKGFGETKREMGTGRGQVSAFKGSPLRIYSQLGPNS